MASYLLALPKDAKRLLAIIDYHSYRDKRVKTFCSSEGVHIPITETAARSVYRCFASQPPDADHLPPEIFQLLLSGALRFVPDDDLSSRVLPPPSPPLPPPSSPPSPRSPPLRRSPSRCPRCRPSSALPQPFKFVDLFAGIGGFAIALRRLNGSCAYSCELNAAARSTYSANFGPAVPHCVNVQQLSPSSLPPFDLLTGGFPCQPFSVLGSMGAFSDARGTLHLEVVRLLRSCQPPAVLLENVPGLANLEGGKVLRSVVKDIENAGYRVFVKVYDAANLLPQQRKRLFFVGIRCDLQDAVDSFSFPSLVPDLGTFVGDIVEPPSELPADLALSPELHAKVAASDFAKRYPKKKFVGPEQQKAATLVSSYAKGTHFSQYFLSSFEDGDKSPPPAPIPSPPPRLFSPREVARLQGFPDSFVLPSGSANPYKQLGNAVPPPLVALVAGNLLCAIMHGGEEKEEGEVHLSLGERVAIDLCRDSLPERSRVAFDERARRALEKILETRSDMVGDVDDEVIADAEEDEDATNAYFEPPAAIIAPDSSSRPPQRLSQIFAVAPSLAEVRKFTHDSPNAATSRPVEFNLSAGVLEAVLSHDTMLGSYRCTLTVQGSLIGALFGVAGAVINGIRKATGATIFVERDKEFAERDEELTSMVEIFQDAADLERDRRRVSIKSPDEKTVKLALSACIATLYSTFTADVLQYAIRYSS